MEDLRKLVSDTAVGQKLLAALEPLADSDLPGLMVALLQEMLHHAARPEANGLSTRASLEDAVSVIPSLTFLTPRGKQDLAFFDEHFLVKTAKADISVPYHAIQHLAIVELPKDTKKRVFLHLHISQAAKVLNGKAPVSALVIQTTEDATLDVPHPSTPSERLAGPAAVVICQAFGVKGLDPAAFCSPDGEAFRSAGGQAGVEAYVKASQGFLFPMVAGLCFLERPALFIPHAAIRCVEFARASGASSTFDLYVHKKDGSTQEFSNISRNEIGAFEDFVRRCKLAVGTGESSDESDKEEGVPSRGEEASAAGSDSDDDSEDEDFDPTASSSSGDEEEGEEERGRAEALGQGVEAGLGPSTSAAHAGKRKRPGGGAEESSGAGAAGCEGDASSEGSDESGDESSDDDDDEGSVELVSEEEFSTGQLRSMIASEGAGGKDHKKQRRR